MERAATTAYIGLGANLGDRLGALRAAVRGLEAHPAMAVRQASSVYESAAHTIDPEEEQPPYLNAVVAVETTLGPEALMEVLHTLERQAGRRRRRRWAPRPLDLDLLVYGRESFDVAGLVVPHPRLAERRFVLEPLAEIAPALHVPPPFDASVAVLRARCSDAAPLTRRAEALR